MSTTTDISRQKAADSDIIRHYQDILRHRLLIMLLVAAIVASLLLDFTMGPSGLSLDVLWQTLTNPSQADAGTRVIVWDIRLLYALMALIVVLALGLADAEMQTILNNPLASPFTVGVSSAAAFGAALAIVLGIGIPGIPAQWFISANAFLFALMAALLLDGITSWTNVATSGVVLFGIALVFTFNALVSMLQFIANEDTLQGLVFWTMGSLARASWEKLGVLLLAAGGINAAVVYELMEAHRLASRGRSRHQFWHQRAPFTSGDAATHQYSLCAVGGVYRPDRFYWSGCATHCPHGIRRRSPLLFARQRPDWCTGVITGIGGV